MKYTVNSLEEMQKIAGDFVANIKPNTETATVVGLSGDLGAGKTSFSQGVAKALGIEEHVVSPTFVIEKIYELPRMGVASSQLQVASGEDSKGINLDASNLLLATSFSHLIHIDAYRLELSDELVHLGWHEITSNPHNLILIEWPERVADIMPSHISTVFTHVSENVREVEINL